MAEPKRELADARHLLVIRPDELGDFVLTSAFLRELSRSAPRASITLVLKQSLYPLAEACPYVDRVLAYDWESCPWTRWRSWHLKLRALRLWISGLATTRFDRVFLPRGDEDIYGARFLASLCAPREKIEQNSLIPGTTSVTHEVQRSLDFLVRCGGVFASDRLEVWTKPEDEAWAENYLSSLKLENRIVLAVHPSGGKSRLKQWPVEKFAETLRRLKAERDFCGLVIGGPDEKALGHSLQQSAEFMIDLTGRLTLRQMAALLRRCDLFFGGDSGPMHVAATAGAPVVAVFGPTNIARFAPFGEAHRVVSRRLTCSPNGPAQVQDRCWECLYADPLCLTELPVDPVLDALRQSWPKSPPRRLK